MDSKMAGYAVGEAEGMKIKVYIESAVTDLVQAETYRSSLRDGRFTTEDGRVLSEEQIAEVCDEQIRYTVDGELSEEEGRYVIRYREPEELGCENAVTSLIFDPEDRAVLTMIRSGDMAAALRFDLRERRQLCSYETPFLPIEFTVNTRRVENGVGKDGGEILLDYFLEIRGVNTERTRMKIRVQPL